MSRDSSSSTKTKRVLTSSFLSVSSEPLLATLFSVSHVTILANPIDEPQPWEYSCTVPSSGSFATRRFLLPFSPDATQSDASSPSTFLSINRLWSHLSSDLPLVDAQVPSMLGFLRSSRGHALRSMRGSRQGGREFSSVIYMGTFNLLRVCFRL